VDQRPSEASKLTHPADHPRLTDDPPLYTFSHDYSNISVQQHISINQS